MRSVTLGVDSGDTKEWVRQSLRALEDNSHLDLPGAFGGILSGAATAGEAIALLGLAPTECRMVKSGSNLVLLPFNGNMITVDGEPRTIPDAGVALSPAGRSTGDTGHIYARWDGSNIVLEFSTTAFTLASGLPLKTGDATRICVGFARAIAGPAWCDETRRMFVLSYFNRRPKFSASSVIANTVTGTTPVDMYDASSRAETLAWADEVLEVAANGAIYNHSAAGNTSSRISLSGTGVGNQISATSYTVDAFCSIGLSYLRQPDTLGAAQFDYSGLLVASDTAIKTSGVNNAQVTMMTRG